MAGSEHFDLIAPIYEKIIGGSTTDWVGLLDLPEQGLILDAGGGTGRIALQLDEVGRQVFVYDESKRMLEQARIKPGLNPVCGIVEWLPFSMHTFDRILMVDAFHHLADQLSSIKELWRVLKPGGRLVIEEPDIRNPWVKLISVFERLLFMRSHFWKPEMIAAHFMNLPCHVKITTRDGTAWVIVDKN